MENEIDLLANYIDKVDYANTFHDIAGERKHSIAKIAGDRLKMLNDLLCTIHRDGGQYIAEHGYKKATEDALTIASRLVQEGE
jgi:hypothetical protein